jgi:AraC family transcriptional regulator, arabinose operon regulatory protein
LPKKTCTEQNGFPLENKIYPKNLLTCRIIQSQCVLLFKYEYLFPQNPNLAFALFMINGAEIVSETEFVMSRSHAPSTAARGVFNVVLRSARFRASGVYRVDERHHELLYCLGGVGYVLSRERRFRFEPFDLVWLSGSSAHCADQTASWEVLSMGVAGHQIDHARSVLSAKERPVFTGLPKEEAFKIFHRVNELLGNSGAPSDAALNCCVTELLGYMAENREAERLRSGRDIQNDGPEVSRALQQMAANIERPWRASQLARLSGWSERHFFRRFKEATGLSPINWLRRERINSAQAQLLNSAASIKEIAGRLGYCDAFFFSRDFKRYTRLSPSEFRRRHMLADDGEAASTYPVIAGR